MVNTIVVVGAGVSGLTSALLLAMGRRASVTVVAKHMPGDYDIEYASPWAGANVSPMASLDDSRWERRTWPELKRLAEVAPETGIHFQKYRIYRREQDMQGSKRVADPMFDDDPWYKDVMPEYRELRANEVIPGHDSGCEFTSVCINTATYLQWLLGQCLAHGVVVRRMVLRDLAEAQYLSHAGRPADVIVNATGLGSLRLGGVQDEAMMPVRGQTVLVRNECTPMVSTSGTDDGDTEILYLMQRAGGGGTILGGTYDMGNWESAPDPNIAVRIMRRAVEACPDLVGGEGRGIEALSIVRHNVGLRPYRKGGVRIERERLRLGDGRDEATAPWVVHNYGHAGWGYQGSYGCAERVVELVNEIRLGLPVTPGHHIQTFVLSRRPDPDTKYVVVEDEPVD
ncbi:D-amino acid oxidase [Purpureocillium takamizusanense]|uniref:D-amino acid oxidase n=1 Tax=Purpureocillium takamizusanense TaxID=2060973 RepID=A0A9Q8Q5P9_9HYPO|nr:D-amino acid oxidase [Purpureocillium takamizusanense]UNI13257.1 D-amino acid oxidase [Purpureocillium takamizusanense]